jgi:hypothetical protein
MSKPSHLCLLVVCTVISLFGQNAPQRITGSPYPAAPCTPTLIYEVDNYKSLTLQTLQGLLAKKGYFLYRHTAASYDNFLNDIRSNYGVTVNADYKTSSEYGSLLTFFKSSISGYVLCNSADKSVNVAISLCGILDAIAVTEEDTALMSAIGIARLQDVRDRSESWALDTYGDLYSRKILGYNSEAKAARFLADYSVFSGAFHFWEPETTALCKRAFARMSAPSVALGWGADEYRTVGALSQNSIITHPADFACNLSVLSSFNARQPLVQKTPPRPFETRPNTHVVCFVMSDGYNLQWALGDFHVSAKWFGSANRGKVNLGWTISPALAELAPTALSLFYQLSNNETTGRDHFIAGPSGVGYYFPGSMPRLDTLAQFQARMLEKAGLRIVNIINPGNQPWAQSFLQPYLSQSNIDAVFYYPYENYYLMAQDTTKIMWVDNKPAITGRNALWSGVETPVSLARKLNSYPRNPGDPQSYSLIPVHAWSYGVDSVVACVQQLDTNVRVVAPDEFVWLVQNNLGALAIRNAEPRPGPSGVNCRYDDRQAMLTITNDPDEEATRLSISLYDLEGRLIDRIFSGMLARGAQTFSVGPTLSDCGHGLYILRVTAGGKAIACFQISVF